MNSLGIENSSQETVTVRECSGNELLMNERRPTPKHIAKSKGDGTGYWFDNSSVIAAQSVQLEMISEMDWADTQLKYHLTNDTERTVSTVDLLHSFIINCRNHVRNVDGVLTVVGNKPIRPL